MEDSSVLISALRLAQIFFAVVSTGITAYLVATTFTRAPRSVFSTVNFVIFVCVLNLVVGAYGLASRYVTKIAVPMVQLALEIGGSVFALVGGLVVSIKLGLVDCGQIATKYDDREWIAWWGDWSPDLDQEEQLSVVRTRCRVFQADNAFIYMMFITGLVGTFLAFRVWKSGRGGLARGVV